MLTSPKLQRVLMGILVGLLGVIGFIVVTRGSGNNDQAQASTIGANPLMRRAGDLRFGP